MGGSGGGSTSSTQQTIAPELRPLFKQTGSTIADLQPQIAGQFGEFFNPNVQNIPGLTQGQQDIRQFQGQRAFGPMLNQPENMALNSIQQMMNAPMGSSPQTIAAMQAARDPALNDLAMAGLGNSDAVGTALTGAYAPILAQEMQQRQMALPQLQQLGQTAANRQSQLLGEYGQTEESARGITEAQGKAALADFLRRQGLGTQFTTGLLGSNPFSAGGGSTTSTKGGGK